MALSDKEKTLLEELTLKANSPDADDWDLEIFDLSSNKGARLPVSKAGNWLYDTFGIGNAPVKENEESEPESETAPVKIGRFGVKN
jgi:hypothetical protein